MNQGEFICFISLKEIKLHLIFLQPQNLLFDLKLFNLMTILKISIHSLLL